PPPAARDPRGAGGAVDPGGSVLPLAGAQHPSGRRRRRGRVRRDRAGQCLDRRLRGRGGSTVAGALGAAGDAVAVGGTGCGAGSGGGRAVGVQRGVTAAAPRAWGSGRTGCAWWPGVGGVAPLCDGAPQRIATARPGTSPLASLSTYSGICSKVMGTILDSMLPPAMSRSTSSASDFSPF